MPRPNPYTPETEAAIVRDYQAGKSMHELVRVHGGSRDTIRSRLDAAGVTLRTKQERQVRLPCWHEAFADAESNPEAAYWVGFLMADGCIIQQKSSTWVVLGLGERDASHVTAFRDFVKSEHKITIVPPTPSATSARRGAGSRIAIESKRMASDLARFGVLPRKSKTAEVKILENDRHFWRGVVDGDGSLGMQTRRKATHRSSPLLQVVGSELLIKQFQLFANRITQTAAKAHPAHGCWAMALHCGAATQMISHLYTDCTVALPRKWALAHELLCTWEMRSRRREIEGRAAF